MKVKEEQEFLMPREKLSRLGADALTDSELLAILLRTGVKGHSVTEVASSLLNTFNGSLQQLCQASVKELCQVQGMGLTKSLELCAAFALAKRMSLQRLAQRPEMRNPQLISNHMRDIFSNTTQEEFHVLMLDTQMRLIRAERITIGLADRSLVHAREVFRNAIRESCSSIILCHNHPSGHVRPSKCDIDVTNTLAKAGEIIGIRVIDHIIVGNRLNEGTANYYSFLEQGRMPNQPNI
jgi:DNA repair protein RadC